MTGVPDPDAAQFPAADDLAQGSCVIQEGFARPKRQLIDGIHCDVVAHVEYAWAFVTGKAVYIFRAVRLAAADRSVINGMGPGITCLEGQAIGKAAFEAEKKGVVSAGSDVGFVIYRTIGISSGIILVKSTRANDVAARVSPVRLGRAEIHSSPRKQAHSPRSKVLRRHQEVRG